MSLMLYTLCGVDPARHFSPHVWKAVMALKHKGLDFEERPTRFTEIPGIEGGITKTVPVLRHDETVIVDSFAIAEYLERTWPDRPSLFGGEGGRTSARLVEAWSFTELHPLIRNIAVRDIWTMLDDRDQAYFRSSREERFGATLEDLQAGRGAMVPQLLARLEPMRMLLARQPFIGGDASLFADYILFGALQWLRVTGTLWPLQPDDVVTAWFERCLDLHGGAGRAAPARL